MRISDWSSDVFSSYLLHPLGDVVRHHGRHADAEVDVEAVLELLRRALAHFLACPSHFRLLPSRRAVVSPRGSYDARYASRNPGPRRPGPRRCRADGCRRSEEHTSELQSLMRHSYAVFCLKKKQTQHTITTT